MPSNATMDVERLNPDLIHAIKTGASAAFEQALSRGASVEACDQFSNTALMIAVGCQSLPMTQRLLASGANINALSEICPQSALHIAARHNSLEITELLLNKGADVNLAARHGKTPLHTACEAGLLPQVRLLLDRGANPMGVPDTSHTSPVLAALMAGQFEVAAYLLARIPDLFRNCDGNCASPLNHFAYWKNAKMVEWLLNQPMPDWLKSNPAYFRVAAAAAVQELQDYEQPDNYEAARSATIELFRQRGDL